MQSGEGDHPLRADPLQALPDAIPIPRRPRPRQESPPVPHLEEKSADDSSAQTLPISTFDQRMFEENALALLQSSATDSPDPLISAIGEKNIRPPSPPAGHAFATNIHDLTAIEDPRDDRYGPPVTAAIVDRADVTLLPDEPKKGSAAGVYLVRSRRNGTSSPPSAGPSTSLSSNQSSEPEYYNVRRSIADFVWLEDRLKTRYEGIIVPPLPSMAIAGRLHHGYAYDVQRLRGLERFLRRVATHAVLSTGDEVLSFLGATSEEVWEKLRKEPIIHESSVTSVLFGNPRGSDDNTNVVQRMSRWSEKILWQAGRKLNKGVAWFLERDSATDGRRKEDSAEARLERLQTYVADLNLSLAAVRLAAGKVAASRNQEMKVVSSLQSALQDLAHREGGKFGAILENVVLDISEESKRKEAAAGTVSRDAEESGQTEAPDSTQIAITPDRILEEVFQDYEERANGAQGIMNARREEQDAYEHALAVYTRLRDKLESRTGSMWETVPNANTASSEGLEELVSSVNAASNRLVEVRKHYQGVAVSTTDELRRLRLDMHDEVCDALRGIAVEYAKQHAAHSVAWNAFAEQMQKFLDPSPED